MDMRVVENRHLHSIYSLMILTPADGTQLPDAEAGQFVQVAVPDSPHTFLRRPISINRIDKSTNTIWLLVRKAGEGTAHLIDLPEGCVINILLPLGRGFSLPAESTDKLLLIGGGVGVAPLLFLGEELKNKGYAPEFLLGARSAADVLELEEFERIGKVYVSTEDGSLGERGLVTQHSVLDGNIEKIYCCGPAPMMKAVAAVARRIGAACEVSLENMMACGVGACLCCVEKTVRGNVCVCTEGPVFNINDLTW